VRKGLIIDPSFIFYWFSFLSTHTYSTSVFLSIVPLIHPLACLENGLDHIVILLHDS